jgi:hypothetical protein
MPQIGGADDLSAGAFRRASLEGATSGLTPSPTKRVHDPSRVATHGVALWSAGQSAFRSARNVMALLVSRLRLALAGRRTGLRTQRPSMPSSLCKIEQTGSAPTAEDARLQS